MAKATRNHTFKDISLWLEGLLLKLRNMLKTLELLISFWPQERCNLKIFFSTYKVPRDLQSSVLAHAPNMNL